MRVLMLLILAILLLHCSQSRDKAEKDAFVFDTTKVIFDIDSLRQANMIRCEAYADTLNQWKEGDLPRFLEEELEGEYAISPDVHHLVSFRKTMFDQVHNRNALRAIFESKNQAYVVAAQASAIPHSSNSIRDLAKMGYDELAKQDGN